MPIDTITQPADAITLEDIDFHPLVKAALHKTLETELRNLEQVAPDRLLKFQGRVEVLRWLLDTNPASRSLGLLLCVLKEQREKAKAAETAE